MHGTLRIIGRGPESRSNVSVGSHQHGSAVPDPVNGLKFLAKEVGLVTQERSVGWRRPNGAISACQQDHGPFKQIENGSRTLIAQDPYVWGTRPGTSGGDIVVNPIGDFGRHRAIADKCSSLIDDSEILPKPRPGAAVVGNQLANSIPLSAKTRLDDDEDFARVFVGIFHSLQRRAMTLRFIAIQERLAGLPANNGRKFPRQVVGILQPGVHALTAHGAMDMRRIAEQKAAALTEPLSAPEVS